MSPRPEVIQDRFLLDGAPVWRIRCPGCGVLGIVDEDQYQGRVSIQCATDGCGYHETHDLSKAEEAP